MKTINEENYVVKAEEAILRLKGKINPKTGKAFQMVTTSKIRNLLAMTSDIYNNVLVLQSDELDSELKSRIEYLRMRFIYEYGRDDDRRNDYPVQAFINESKILDILKEISGSRANYILFNHYMEALIAFHRFNGGKNE